MQQPTTDARVVAPTREAVRAAWPTERGLPRNLNAFVCWYRDFLSRSSCTEADRSAAQAKEVDMWLDVCLHARAGPTEARPRSAACELQ